MDQFGWDRIGRRVRTAVRITTVAAVIAGSVGMTSVASAVSTSTVGDIVGVTDGGRERVLLPLAAAPMAVSGPLGSTLPAAAWVTDSRGRPLHTPRVTRVLSGPLAPRRDRPAASPEVRHPWRGPAADLPDPATAPTLEYGDEDESVAVLEGRLEELGYRPGDVDGWFSDSTWSAVLAFQKAERLERTGSVDAATWRRLAAPQAWPVTNSITYPRVEVDLERQVALVVLGPTHVVTVNTSTGGGYEYKNQYGYWELAETPVGGYQVYRRYNGTERAPLGTLYRPLYFHQGYAIHGSPYVPDYPDSHGCVRLSNEDQDWLWDLAPDDLQVTVYRTMDPGELFPGTGRWGAPGLPAPPRPELRLPV
jgi:peptidoglycan hydrolase-like protein with peptidoglycan-binding domain